MRSPNWIWVWILAFLVFCPFEDSFSQDLGIRDTLRFGPWSAYVPGPPYQGEVLVPLVVFNDIAVSYVRIPLRYTGPIEFDTAYFAEGRPDGFDTKIVDFDTSANVILFIGAVYSRGNPMPPGVGPIAWIHFDVQDTGLAELDTAYLGPMYPVFDDTGAHSYFPEVVKGAYDIVPSVSGDVNHSGEVDIADVIFLINYLFMGGSPPDFIQLGDVNADCGLDVGDVIYLINYLFLGGSTPQFGGC